MKKVSWRRFSLLGLTLIAVSAVTAAVAKSNSTSPLLNGSLTQLTARGGNMQTDDGFTCTVSAGNVCNASTAQAGASNTTANGGTEEGAFQTNDNTTANG